MGDNAPLSAHGSTPWRLLVNGACWSMPEGLGSSIVGRESHPVVQVSARDAEACAAWSGGRLPSEAD
ncbi:formylglycine-generating enzyme family protein [Brucella sp. 21LCYQ03]|nr:formylglycine-generating enzyme family protein [Brucella sp. 21LCYQ03]